MNSLQLITDVVDFGSYEMLLEQDNVNKPRTLKIKGPYIVAEQMNANKRIYDKGLMERVISGYKKDYIDAGTAYCELNHQQSTSVNPKEASDRILSLTQQDNIWIGESIVLCSDAKHGIIGTPNGDIVASLLQHGGKIGKSTRGVGSINENTGRIDTDYRMITVDTVLDPSGPNCFVDGILENKEFMINTHGQIIECAFEAYEKSLQTLPLKNKQDAILSMFDTFLKSI